MVSSTRVGKVLQHFSNKKIVLFILIVYFYPVLIHSVASTTLSDTVRTGMQGQRISSFNEGLSQYSTHDPILIDGNADFHNQSSTEGWTGEGTLSDPYIIGGYNISGYADGISIEIRNTDRYFIINNSFFSYGLLGIFLFNVSNGHINSTTIEYMFGYDPWICGAGCGGILIERCNNVTICNNILEYQILRGYQHGVVALRVWRSKQCVIENNTITNMYEIMLSSSENIRIFRNFIKRCPLWLANSRNISLGLNEIISGQDQSIASPHGIGLYNLSDSILFENIVKNSDHKGIWMTEKQSTNILISNNEITNNDGGVSTFGFNITISGNTFVNNGYGVETTSSCIVEWNNFIGDIASGYGAFDYNYWDSWTSPDHNNDGIVDNPFLIEGGDNFDYHPLVLPVHLSMWRPKVIFPKGGEILSGKVIINWATVSGISFPSLSYSVYYSSDEGSSWVELVSNIQETNYSWDTTAMSDWTNSLIRIMATHPNDTSLEGSSNSFFTIINDPQILETLDQGYILGDLETYELTLYLDNKAFTGTTSLSFSSFPSVSTQFGTYSSVTMSSFSDCTLNYSSSNYIVISNWNSYYDNENSNLIKSENTWFVHVSGYQQATLTMMFEYGSYNVVADNTSVYEETYTQCYYEDGVLQETLQCEDITSFDEIQTISIDAGTFECIRMRTVNYEGILKPNEFVGYSLVWIDKNGSLIKESAFDEQGSLSLSMILKVTKSPTSSSPKGTPAWTFVLVTTIIVLLVLTKKRRSAI